MNRVFLIAAVGIAIVALIFLTQGIKKASPTDEDLQKQAQQDAQKAAPPAPQPTAPITPATTSAILPPEETDGNPATAKRHIQVGWVYEERNLAQPQTLTVPLQAIRDFVQQSGGTVSAEIADLDVPSEDRSPAARGVVELGIVVDGKPVVSGNLSDAPQSSRQISQMLAGAVK